MAWKAWNQEACCVLSRCWCCRHTLHGSSLNRRLPEPTFKASISLWPINKADDLVQTPTGVLRPSATKSRCQSACFITWTEGMSHAWISYFSRRVSLIPGLKLVHSAQPTCQRRVGLFLWQSSHSWLVHKDLPYGITWSERSSELHTEGKHLSDSYRIKQTTKSSKVSSINFFLFWY